MSDDDRTKEERGQALGNRHLVNCWWADYVYESHLRTTIRVL